MALAIGGALRPPPTPKLAGGTRKKASCGKVAKNKGYRPHKKWGKNATTALSLSLSPALPGGAIARYTIILLALHLYRYI